MKRLLLAASGFVGVLAVVFVVFFTVSDFRVEGQSYFHSLSDFVFMIRSHNTQAFGSAPPPALTPKSYERVMSHAGESSHSEVRRRVVWSLARFGEDIVPFLLQELDEWKSPARVLIAARVLGELRVAAAAPKLEVVLEMARSDRRLAVGLIDAMSEVGPAAAPGLISSYRGYRARGEDPPYNFLDAIGKSGGGAEFLIAEMARARTEEETLRLEWPLAFTKDPRAAKVLAGLLRHPTLAVRRRARDSMTQSMGEVAIEPVVDVLEVETDDYVRSSIIQQILAGPDAASSARAVELLGRLLDDPVLAWEANYALAQIGTERAVEILHQRAATESPDAIMENLEYTGALAVKILADYIRHEDPHVRRLAIDKLVALDDSRALPLLLEVVDDPDFYTRRFAREAVRGMDHVLLEESARNWMLQKTGRLFGRLRPPEREGTRSLFTTLRFFHWVALGASVLVGLLLLSGYLRAFEQYKLTLVLAFLLLVGIVGDFLFFTEPTLYRFATAGRLLLLLGLLFLRDDPLPGDTRARVERLAVRSLWVLIPLLLVYGLPVLTEALRHALRDFGFLWWTLLVLLGLLLLVFEQAVLPWDLFPRGGRAERGLAFLVSTTVVGLVAAAVWRFLEEPSVAVDEDRFFFGGILLLPLLGAWAFHLRESRLFAPRVERAVPVSSPPGRLRVVHDGESLVIRIGRKRGFHRSPRLVLGALLFAGVFWLADGGAATSAGAPALVLLAILTMVAIALVWVFFSGVVSGVAIQIRGPAVRAATTFLGGAFGRSAWVRRPRLPVVLGELSLDPREKAWLAAAVRGPKPVASPELSISLDTETSGGTRLLVTNVGKTPASIADFEAVDGAPLRLDGRCISLSRVDRETPVLPGARRAFSVRAYAATLLLAFVFLSPRNTEAAIVAEHPSDYTRVLESGSPALWNEATTGLLGEKDELPLQAVSSVMRRFDGLDPTVRVRVVRALRHHPRHPRTIDTLARLVRQGEGNIRDTAAESLLALRTPEAMDVFQALILEGSSYRSDALKSLVASFDSVSQDTFHERYLPSVRVLLRSEDVSVRLEAMNATLRVDSPALRDEWAHALEDPDPDIRWKVMWQLAERGDQRPCPALIDWTKTVAPDPDALERIAEYCARADEDAGVNDEEAREANWKSALRGGAFPFFLVFSAACSALMGALLFVWAFRLWSLAARVRNRPISRAGSVASGPVALEGEAQPSGSYLRHPVTGEPCLYYVGAEVDHPKAQFYLEDDSGRVLIDPRRAVLFTEDGVLVAGERLHIVGFASGRSPVVIGKDDVRRPLYARVIHGLISAVFGFGRTSSVSKMLFSDPRYCFWIWDDLERRPMEERRDQMWLGLSVLVGGAWILVFAISVLGLLDRDMSETLGRAFETFERSGLP